MAFQYKEHYKMKKARLRVLEKYKGKCIECGKAAIMVHHRDGSLDNHDEENLVPMCYSCHTRLHYSACNSRWDTDKLEHVLMLRGLDKGELATRIGMTSPALTRLFKIGRTKNSTMRKIADVLDWPLEDFVTSDKASMSG